MAKDFLLEIGTEEIPAKFAPGVLNQLREQAQKYCQELRLDYQDLKVYTTPRRFAVLIQGLAEKQTDFTAEVKGPAVKAAYDAEGNPTKAAQGFARGQGVEPKDLFVQELNGVSYVYARKFELGQPTLQLLPKLCTDLITGLHFPKPMRWADLEFRFARPIRWIVALFGSEVIPFEFVGLASGKASRGHRTLGGPVTLDSPADYEKQMLQAFVMVDPEQRRQSVWEQIHALAAKVGGDVEKDDDLLDEVTHIIEYPTALLGEVAPNYMHLPEPVITTPMKEHQRYFPVRDKEGKLLPYFITVRNGDDYALAKVKAGNEKVLKARLEDAAFYYREDQKTPLAELVEKLDKVTYHEKLGSVRQRVERIRTLARGIAARLGMESEKQDLVERTALLAKADLVTLMVYDFPELQGIMGADYARMVGEKPEVCTGILEHYQPRFAGDELPQSYTGQIVSVADKLDAIVGAFGIGIQPTGSQDPYALRRQAQGVVGIILEAGWDISLEQLIAASYVNFAEQGISLLPLADLQSALQDFFQQRLRFVLQEQGARYDTLDAVLAQGSNQITRAARKAQVLAAKRETTEFVPYSQAYIRCLNLSKKAQTQPLDPKNLIDPTEIALAAALVQRQEAFAALIEKGDYAEAYALASELIPMIEALFNAVMIMVEDEILKQARLALLGECVAILGCLGDLSLLA
ncbi:glycyl-tRNA synthetase, beta subunit [Desulfitobacterium hafniense DCB-2]|uniref:Glycine--tRNA ligase beta subunit n=3 Tax=Desulfitobacterium hafniense TaxID=49338 RepID=SYGB_DESHD|nr:glycine--tRNA ligase subunit beta [Desulfitobacterium hafniense]B8FUJ0.1 RecName: Full=Glycine--tRNA ligase beta subunit; AltName: Full=Glycyl-tRNA synthetase beta subunit; Short=GlyRS [Desulfitobacterium hafniense DCB-2]ACL22260.1 glycyl-tRNA synthetase, beta subunit [Desulfitobacterium hafniense DCB-2]EHL04677.1 glycine--tRNA ligase, beta subunit [Desulfitobacterium hafniense DP7]CDX03194.1 Glycine--tRNA ligase beta subunit [Desulfitobacterium hafniense]